MTAAALRPDLFTHLFATQRQPTNRGDAAATLLSVAFHAGIVAALIWASSTLRPETRETVADQPIPIVIASSPRAQAPGSTSGSGNGSIAEPSYSITPPMELSDHQVPPASSDPWFEPGPPASATSSETRAGMGRDVTETTKDGFVVSSVVPALLNSNEVTQALVRTYPAFLRDAGIGGDVMIWLLIDENGQVVETEIRSSSGHAELDQAALNVGQVMRFSPARNRDQKVKVWVSVPIRFRTR